MRVEQVEFYSHGDLLRGVLKMPDDAPDSGSLPILIQGPGWLEIVGDPLSQDFHAGFVDGGYAVLQFDYRGFGASEGVPGLVDPRGQAHDIGNAITYVSTRDDLDIGRLGLFALGGLAGGNCIYAARNDPRVKAICAQTVVADGPTWLHEQRREWEWVDFKRRLETNRVSRVLRNEDQRVDPTEEIMIATPERKLKGMPLRGKDFLLSSVDFMQEFRPIEIVDKIGPCALLITSIVDDVVTPEHHANALYQAARGPKRLVLQRNVNHYQGYTVNFDPLLKHFLEWFDCHLVSWSRSEFDHGRADILIIE